MTNRRAEDELLAWFFRFFEFADGEYAAHTAVVEPLFEFVTCWQFWWYAELTREQRARIQNLTSSVSGTAADNFVRRLHEWLAGRFGSSGAAIAVLQQLPAVSVFKDWRAAVRSRVESLKWVNMVAVEEGNDGARVGKIIPLGAFAHPRKGARVKWVSGIALDPTAVGQVYEALRKLLSGSSLILFTVVGFLSGWPISRKLVRALVLLGWFVVACGSICLAFFGHRLEHGEVANALEGIFLIIGLLILCPLFHFVRDLLFASHLAQILSQSQVGILLKSQMPGAVLAPDGTSYTLALVLAMLAALLDKAEPERKSWLWGKFAEWVKGGRPHWVFTGDLRANGRIGNVNEQDLKPKYDACLLGDGLTDFVTPRQAPKLPAVAPKPEQPVPAGGAGSLGMRLHRSWHLATLILRLSGIKSWTACLATGLALISTVALCFAIPEMQSHRIVVTVIPPCNWEGNTNARIVGLAAGISRRNAGDHRIVIYSKSKTGDWWVQPAAVDPFTKLTPEGTFEQMIYTGGEYAVLLVSLSFNVTDAPPRTLVLPAKDGKKVEAVHHFKGAP